MEEKKETGGSGGNTRIATQPSRKTIHKLGLEI